MLIVAALPDPVGVDRGHEVITLLNTMAAAIDLTGWGLVVPLAAARTWAGRSLTAGWCRSPPLEHSRLATRATPSSVGCSQRRFDRPGPTKPIGSDQAASSALAAEVTLCGSSRKDGMGLRS